MAHVNKRTGCALTANPVLYRGQVFERIPQRHANGVLQDMAVALRRVDTSLKRIALQQPVDPLGREIEQPCIRARLCQLG